MPARPLGWGGVDVGVTLSAIWGGQIFLCWPLLLSLAQALIHSGAGVWMATILVQSTPALTQRPLLLIVALLLVTALPVRLLIPDIRVF